MGTLHTNCNLQMDFILYVPKSLHPSIHFLEHGQIKVHPNDHLDLLPCKDPISKQSNIQGD